MEYVVTLYGTKCRCKEWVMIEASSKEEAEELAESGHGVFVEEESGNWEDFSVLEVIENK